LYNTLIGTDIDTAIHFLKQNELVAIPTETVYGLAANALDATAVAKIFEAKNRPFFNPLIIHTNSVASIYKYAEIDELSLQLANHFMPGPFTLLLPKKDSIPDIVTAGSNKVAVRIPNHPITQNILNQISFPLAAPSANVFGYVSPVTAKHVWQGLQNKIPYIVDGGHCNVGLESTIIEVQNKEVIVHRVGGLSIEEIEKFTHQKTIKASIDNANTPHTSGQLKSHYATTTPLIQGNVINLHKDYTNKNVAILSLYNEYDFIEKQNQFQLSKNGNLNEAAQNLFTIMRQLDELNFDIILAEYFPNEGLGIAINDRLKKAQFTEK
jgi:L-threonylcarbamoyladenylate synthase